MSKYILKKTLPFAKAGKEVWLYKYPDNKNARIMLDANHCDISVEDLSDWIEEVKPREWFVALNYLDEIIFCGKLNPQQIYEKVIKVREVID